MKEHLSLQTFMRVTAALFVVLSVYFTIFGNTLQARGPAAFASEYSPSHDMIGIN